jgi:hypothetical protein
MPRGDFRRLEGRARPTPLQSVSQRAGQPEPAGNGDLPGVGGIFRVCGVFASATEVAARFYQQSSRLRIVGLLRWPSMVLCRVRLNVARTCEGLPVRVRPGVG